jgi:hypothetical protein
MSALTNVGENNFLNSMFRTQAAYKPAAIYIGLFTAVTDAEAGTVTEVTGGSYARQQITQADAQWNAPTNSSGAQMISNVNAVNFPTASASWGTVTHIGIYDAVTAGNLIMVLALTASRTVNNGDTFSIPAGSLQITAA